MKTQIILILMLTGLLSACNKESSQGSDSPISTFGSDAKHDGLYFDYTVDGYDFHVEADDILTTYSEFSGNDREFKIYAGKEGGTTLMPTIPADMSKPSSTPSGSSEVGSKIFQGSVSLQGYPKKGYTFNSYDGFADPKPAPKADAIVITNSDKIGEEGRIITGTVNTSTVAGGNSSKDPDLRSHSISGKFKIKHIFSGTKF